MKKLNGILFSLIAPVICGENAETNAECGIRNSDFGAELNEQTLRAVYALAKKHDLGHLLARGVRNAEINSEFGVRNSELGEQLPAELERAELTAVWRVRNIENEQGRVRKCLESGGIPFILLKGAVIRGYYPEAWMRTSSDIDLLVPRGRLAEAVELITGSLDYRISTTEQHDASLFSRSGVHLDMHTLFEGDGEDCRLLEWAWVNAKCKMQNAKLNAEFGIWNAESGEETVSDGAVASSGCEMHGIGLKDVACCEHYLTDEAFYFYHVAHMAKHMRNGGCGIRPFIDLYLIRQNTDCDRAALDEMLTRYGLSRFESAAVALSDLWMQGGEVNAECGMRNAEFCESELAAFEEYVLTGGVYGSSEQYVAARQRGGRRGKFRYILGRIFMPYSELKKRHPVLEKHKWLTPVFEVWRWCGLAVPSRLKRGGKELSSAMRVDGARVTSVETLLESLGL